MCVKNQLTFVIVDSYIVVFVKNTAHLTNAEYAYTIYLYGFCDGSATAAVKEYRRLFPMRRIPYRIVFYKVFNTLCECGTLSSAHVSSERARKQNMEEQENILDMVQRSPTTSTQRL